MIDPVFIQDERIGKATDLQQSVPVRTVAGQARDFKAENNAGASHADFRDQFLKPLAIGRTLTRLTLIAVHDSDLLQRPAEGDGALLQSILPFRAFLILQDLARRGLADIEESSSLQMANSYFPRCFHSHTLPEEVCPNAMEAKIRTASAWRSEAHITGVVDAL